MKRDKSLKLREWRKKKMRKPLIVRGARQVGKTWLVRELGKEFPAFVEISFERNPEFGEIFRRGLEPKKIVAELSAATDYRIAAGRTLLFFDEVQECPEAIKSLRYFYEEMPELHLIAAGSLMGFAIENVPTGVGRVSYLNLYPLSFGEFLEAMGNGRLRHRIVSQETDEPLLEIHHRKLLDIVRQYMLVGGMPAVVSAFVEGAHIQDCQDLLGELLQSFADDFVKYSKEPAIPHLQQVFSSVPIQLGQKYVYSRVDRDIRSHHFSKALELLETAGLVYKVYHTKADGIPLTGRINPSRFKVILLDIGLLQRMINVDLHLWMTSVDIVSVNRGAIAEQFVGQELAGLTDAGRFSSLTYWHRERRGSSAEIDYVIEQRGAILPVEVKSGAQGGMKSMHAFLGRRGNGLGIKISNYPFSFDGAVRTLPFYAIEKLFA